MNNKDFRVRAMSEIGQRLMPLFSTLERVNKHEYSKWDASYKLKTRDFPYSCTLEEGLVLYYLIRENKLTNGYEIATAFGLSTIFLALGAERTGGRVVTLDCYIEESKESYIYSPEEIEEHVSTLHERISAGYQPNGLEMARKLAALASVQDRIDFKVGTSPQNVAASLEGRRIDFAFIDGGHFGDQPTLDFEAVQSSLGEKCAVFFHDNNNNPAVERAIAKAELFLGTKSFRFNTTYQLTLVSRGIDPESIKPILELPKRRAPLKDRIRYHLSRLVGLKP
jgi:predicted O-methyltransferase YrrM